MPTPVSYWRIRTNLHFVPIGFAEIEMRGSVSGPNLCVGGTPFASNNLTPAADAFDGNLATECEIDSVNPRHVGYEFSSPVDIKEIQITWGSAGTGETTLVALEKSSDGISWTTVGGSLEDYVGPGEVYLFEVPFQPFLEWNVGINVQFLGNASSPIDGQIEAELPIPEAAILGIATPPGSVVGTIEMEIES